MFVAIFICSNLIWFVDKKTNNVFQAYFSFVKCFFFQINKKVCSHKSLSFLKTLLWNFVTFFVDKNHGNWKNSWICPIKSFTKFFQLKLKTELFFSSSQQFSFHLIWCSIPITQNENEFSNHCVFFFIQCFDLKNPKLGISWFCFVLNILW